MSVKNWLLRLLLLVVFCVFNSSPIFGGTTGKIAGKVIDKETGAPLTGVNVIVVGTVLGAATDMQGNFIILRVPPGTYSIKASMIGYGQVQYDDVKVSIDKTATVDFELSAEVLSGKTVTIVATRPLVQKDLTSTEAVVSSEIIDQLPLDRIEDVVNLQAGVVDGHVRGGRAGEVMYMIDGIPVNDVYSGESAFEVENNAVAELQVISGTFNAEYGQAMSGVVNIVTKEGTDTYSGRISSYFGDYVSNHSDIFWNIDNINPIYSFQANLSGPMPVMPDKLKFFISGRYYDSDGYIYGKKIFVPSDNSDFTNDNPEKWVIQSLGKTYPFSEELARSLINKAEAVSMNPENRITLQTKLTYKLTDSDNLTYELLLQKNNYRDYDHRFRMNPTGTYNRKKDGYNNRFTWTHVINASAFFNLRYSNLDSKYNQYVLKDNFDPGYESSQSQRLRDTGAFAFLSGGMQMWHFNRRTTTSLGKFDITSQITNTHQVKFGIEGSYHRLWLHEYRIDPALPERIPPITTISNNKYTHHPIEASVYFQDKMEYKDFILNAGIRYDFFDPDGEVPIDFSSPDTSLRNKAKMSSQVSPRLGIAYPITERGVIHISYGHFFQIPNYDYLYTNPEFDIYLKQDPPFLPHSQLNTIGNADLKPQKTVIYEIGLQQQLSEDIALDVTGYYKDIRNLLGTKVYRVPEGIKYGRYYNRDYGNVKGITISLEKRPSGGVSASLDYTFQIARGNASDPNSAFLDQQTDPPLQTEKRMLPLDWDRRHQVNATVAVGKIDNYNISLIGKFGTGLPYTPTFQNIQTAVENSGSKPGVYNVDLYAYKTLKIYNLKFSLFLRIYNLFDRKNERDVFTDTGRAGYSLAHFYAGDQRPRGLNTLDEYFIRPDFYSDPREVNIGFSLEF